MLHRLHFFAFFPYAVNKVCSGIEKLGRRDKMKQWGGVIGNARNWTLEANTIHRNTRILNGSIKYIMGRE